MCVKPSIAINYVLKLELSSDKFFLIALIAWLIILITGIEWARHSGCFYDAERCFVNW